MFQIYGVLFNIKNRNARSPSCTTRKILVQSEGVAMKPRSIPNGIPQSWAGRIVGLVRGIGNAVGCHSPRGFESHPARHFFISSFFSIS